MSYPLYIPVVVAAPGVAPAKIYHDPACTPQQEFLLRANDVMDRINYPHLYPPNQQADPGHVKAVNFAYQKMKKG